MVTPDKPPMKVVVHYVGLITTMATVGILYEAVVSGKDIAIAGATNLGMLGLGALCAVLGYVQGKKTG